MVPDSDDQVTFLYCNFSFSTSLLLLATVTQTIARTMPVPQDDTLPSDKRAEGSTSSTTVEGADTENIIEKFQQLGQDAADEENEGDDDDDEDEAGEVGQAGASVGEGGEGAGAADKKKKKKKKKGKASKAVDRLKCVSVTLRVPRQPVVPGCVG